MLGTPNWGQEGFAVFNGQLRQSKTFGFSQGTKLYRGVEDEVERMINCEQYRTKMEIQVTGLGKGLDFSHPRK